MADLSKGWGAGDDALADDRVPANERPFVGVERTGLGENRVRDTDLADVMQLGGMHDRSDLVVGQFELAGDEFTRPRSPMCSAPTTGNLMDSA
jgi:hypothetical protein